MGVQASNDFTHCLYNTNIQYSNSFMYNYVACNTIMLLSGI